ncbi:triose-phosphate isomerase [Enterobacteriaceae endosymbiont of Donacia dentata]|uniref:triose-phosphate isomerase n=1 Tax=Enterobacteriaceae endosymbiont of Donacia dentata TaxID=2675777 RepID=UPI001448FD3C|nr:triose-phosphate isomerase [Enterobacteriaceae endosymbiont of Donacia dentata]QJC32460.1 triose-phosphate isomerase [Enterobacteriaceae endosymbiont of Donacia dentata]
MKKFLIIANWKLNGNFNFIKKNINIIKEKIGNSLYFCKLAIAPPYVYINYIFNYLKNTSVDLVAQNVDIHKIGSFTGEISIDMLKDVGVKYVIIGHSERRINHYENNNFIAKKFVLTKKNGLIPILCLGETKEEKNENKTEKICIDQINSILKICDVKIFHNTIIAYEPIWAIGSGKIADVYEIQKTINFIKKYLSSINQKISDNIIFQYGGSIDKNNIHDLFQINNIDGLLVGKASLTIENFIFLVKKAEKEINLLRS